MKQILIVAITTLGLVVGHSRHDSQHGRGLPEATHLCLSERDQVGPRTALDRDRSGAVQGDRSTRRPATQVWSPRCLARRGSSQDHVRQDRSNSRTSPSNCAVRWYRVVKPATASQRRAISKPWRVKTLPWNGRVRAELSWDSGADFNLHLEDPNGDDVSEDNPGPAASGGMVNPSSTKGCAGTPDEVQHRRGGEDQVPAR